MKKLLFTILILLILGAGTFLLISRNQPASSSRIKVAASIFPLSDILKNIGGEVLEVNTVLPIGASEHDYEPTLADQQKLSDTKLLFTIGLGMDNWAFKMLPDVRTVDMKNNIEFLPLMAEDEHAEESEGFDPHYWLSIENAKIIAVNATNELSRLAPQHRELFNKNLVNYQAKLDEAYQTGQSLSKNLKSNKIITFHEAFNYLTKEIGVEIATTIEPFPGKEPSLSYIQEVGQIIRETGIKTLFREPQLSDSVIEPLARDYGAKIATLDPIGGTTERPTYIDLYLYNVRTITDNLK